MVRRSLGSVLVAAAMVAATGVLAGEFKVDQLKIEEVRAPVLMLWNDNQGSEIVKEIPKGEVPDDLPVQAVSDNLMLKVTVGDQSGWVMGHHVKTNNKVELKSTCDPSVSRAEVGAVRGLGENCD